MLDLLSNIETEANTPTTKLRVRVRTSENSPISSWRIRVNGLLHNLIDTSNEKQVDKLAYEREFEVETPFGVSEVQIFADNQHGTSVPATFKVTRKLTAKESIKQKEEEEFDFRPRLYVLSVGAANYS
ncbi:hypothetical protein ACO0KZ_20510, partial [Undibacterium sp. Di24W]